MRRRSPQSPINTTETSRKSSKYDLQRELESLKAQMEAIQAQLDVRTKLGHQRPARAKPSVGKKVPGKKCGPKPRHSRMIYSERDHFVRLLERHWLKIEPLCGRWADEGLKLVAPPDTASIKKILIGLLDPMNFQMAEMSQKLLDRLPFLETFLTDPQMRKYFSGDPKQEKNRFGGDPRQIANALAGVPSVSIWRSLKLCGEKSHQCKVLMGEQAIPSYIRRKHRLLARALDADQGLPLLASFLLSYSRRKDPVLKHLRAVDMQRITAAGRGNPV
jgi:hypothetical protein